MIEKKKKDENQRKQKLKMAFKMFCGRNKKGDSYSKSTSIQFWQKHTVKSKEDKPSEKWATKKNKKRTRIRMIFGFSSYNQRKTHADGFLFPTKVNKMKQKSNSKNINMNFLKGFEKSFCHSQNPNLGYKFSC